MHVETTPTYIGQSNVITLPVSGVGYNVLTEAAASSRYNQKTDYMSGGGLYSGIQVGGICFRGSII